MTRADVTAAVIGSLLGAGAVALIATMAGRRRAR